MNFSELMNALLSIKTQCESIEMKSEDIAKMKIVEQYGIFEIIRVPEITFELAEDVEKNKYILFKNKTK